MKHPALPLPVETERLVIRDFRPGDEDAVYGYARHDDFVRYLEIGRQTPESIAGFVKRCRAEQAADPRREYNLAITLAGDDRPVGGVSLHLQEPRLRKAGLGYALGPEHWGRGIASEAIRCVIALGFTVLGLNRIYAHIHDGNDRSRRVVEKLGLKREGLLRGNTVTLEGTPADEYLYALLADEFAAG